MRKTFAAAVRSSVLTLIALLAIFTLASAQSQETYGRQINSPKDTFARYEAQITNLEQARQNGQSIATLQGATTIFGLQIGGSGQSVETGDEIRLNAYAFADYNNILFAVGRYKNPGEDGVPERGDDAYHYFTPDLRGFFGIVSPIRAESYYRDVLKFRAGRNSGRGVIELLLVDTKSFQLIQHVFTNFYVNTAGPEGQIFGSITKAEIVDGTVTIYGTFTPNKPYFVWQGAKNVTYDGLPYPVYSHDGGKTLQVPKIRTFITRDYRPDVWVFDPDFGSSFGLAKAYNFPASIVR